MPSFPPAFGGRVFFVSQKNNIREDRTTSQKLALRAPPCICKMQTENTKQGINTRQIYLTRLKLRLYASFFYHRINSYTLYVFYAFSSGGGWGGQGKQRL